MSDSMRNFDLPRPISPLQFPLAMPREKKQDQNFGPRLATLRKARGLTQVQLAALAGTTQRAISYYENDDGIPPAAALIDLAKALKVSSDELLGLGRPKTERVEDDAETRRLWKRFQMVAHLPEKDQRAVIRLINSLAAVSTLRVKNRPASGEPA
jgi:transcriptional regulator with XRE-family HTH domain